MDPTEARHAHRRPHAAPRARRQGIAESSGWSARGRDRRWSPRSCGSSAAPPPCRIRQEVCSITSTPGTRTWRRGCRTDPAPPGDQAPLRDGARRASGRGTPGPHRANLRGERGAAAGHLSSDQVSVSDRWRAGGPVGSVPGRHRAERVRPALTRPELFTGRAGGPRSSGPRLGRAASRVRSALVHEGQTSTPLSPGGRVTWRPPRSPAPGSPQSTMKCRPTCSFTSRYGPSATTVAPSFTRGPSAPRPRRSAPPR